MIVGGGKVALRRAKVLLHFGAEVTLIAPAVSELPDGAVHVPRAYVPGDLAGAALAVAAADDRAVNRAVGQEAGRLGIPVSVADAPAECSFYFPAVCEGEDLVAGLVSDGEHHEKTAAAAAEIRKLLNDLE